jgi:hypothetical protein
LTGQTLAELVENAIDDLVSDVFGVVVVCWKTVTDPTEAPGRE